MESLKVIQHEAVQVQDIQRNNGDIDGDLFKRFLKYLDVSEKTEKAYTNAIIQFNNYLRLNGIHFPTREDVIAYRNFLRTEHKPATVQAYMVAIRSFFSWLDVEGVYPDIGKHVKGAKITDEHKRDCLTAGQVKAVLGAVDRSTLKGKRTYAILLLMITCGLRCVEIARADVGDIMEFNGNLVLMVWGKKRDDKDEPVKLMQPAKDAVDIYLEARGGAQEKDDPLFTSLQRGNHRLTTRTISDTAKHAMQAVGLDSERLTAHSLRHTAVTLSLLAGKDLEEVKQFARHASIATTLIYSHAIDKAKNGCSEAIMDAII